MPTVEVYGNSMTYTTEVDGETITASEVTVTQQALRHAEDVTLRGGNLRVAFPRSVTPTVDVQDDTIVVGV